ncbi:MAG: hypothetical protein A3H39_08100 [candidate division NC10 bacterium RIFCSPLOWO2_02_FULL_66_22]|nr:MAG: hypothetical protein A3H39_08100 [candidate division NC10 bacterium RIFCSPLOWO2_02_FULL_66_22]
MNSSSARSLHACILVSIALLVFVLAGCGRKGAPVPPRPVAPAAVGGIRAEPRDSGILVTWTGPSRNEDGAPLTDLLEFRLYRAVGAAPSREAQDRPAFSLLATIRADEPDNAIVRGSQYAFRDDGGGAGLSTGVRYTYRVQAVNRRGVVGPPSVEVFVDFAPAPPPPGGLATSAGDGTVTLTWQAPSGPVPAGTPPVRGYNVYRGLRPGTYGPQPINAGPVVETRFRDAGVENGTTYYYVVRSVGIERPPWRESHDSGEVSAMPVDLTPPAPPRGLVAIPGPGAVALSWNANTEPDLLGYLVYRLEPPALTPIRLTETPVQTTTFTDRTARPGATYIYTVTAVDRSPRRNESAPSSEATVTLP